ncbi:MAG: ribosome silencing factor [Alphaproteobacteria bacterium]|nr:ribosome silencing factor [Rickettsiales bacterium]
MDFVKNNKEKDSKKINKKVTNSSPVKAKPKKVNAMECMVSKKANNSNVGELSNQIIDMIVKVMDDSKLTMILPYRCNKAYFVDAVIIGTGTSTRHVDGAAQKIIKSLKQEQEIVPLVDKKTKEWIVVDAGFVIVHIMLEKEREYYNIDALMSEREEKPAD